MNNLYNQAKSQDVDWLMFDRYRNIKGKLNYFSSVNDFSKLTNNIYELKGQSIVNFLINHAGKIGVFRYIVKKNFLQENKCIFPENTTSEDYVALLWFVKAKIISYIPNAYYIYRKRRNSTTTSKIKRNQYKDNITMLLAVASLIDVNDYSNVYLGVRLLIGLLLYQHPLIKEFNRSEESHKQQIVEDMAKTIEKISFVFKSEYFDEAIAFGKILIPKKYNKEDLVKLIDALKNSNNQDNLKSILYESYTKLNKDNKIKQIFRGILQLTE